ncbi:hypothetical protein RJT34_25796 [Clitoria ternatea]|uniref:Uncharacterized protein n=1 Tax=Clitoria ternatea TaxID=43366 RepID=A0AAN9FT08_CLITE
MVAMGKREHSRECSYYDIANCERFNIHSFNDSTIHSFSSAFSKIIMKKRKKRRCRVTDREDGELKKKLGGDECLCCATGRRR